MTPHQREQAIEHLLRRASGDTVPTAVCLDAETAAAWVEGRLAEAELQRARVHVADCARCQALMASIAAATPVGAEVDREPGWRHWLRWAAPAAAGAIATAAVAVWLNVAPTPTSPREAATRNEVSDVRRAQPPNAESPAVADPQPQAFADGQRGVAGRAASNADQGPPVTSVRPPAAPAPAPAPTPAGPQARRFDGLTAPNAAVVGGASAARRAPASADQKVSAAAVEPGAAAAVEQSFARPSALRQIVSPDPSVRWRLAGDRVERTTDDGTRWTAATRLDSSAITAGSAPGVLVCWLVGHGGIVFLTTDGVTFRQVTAPATIDLVAVSAADESSATVTASDGRRYTTTDGGASWSPATVR